MSLMNTQYDSIMRMYAARQARSRQEYEERMEQIQKDGSFFILEGIKPF